MRISGTNRCGVLLVAAILVAEGFAGGSHAMLAAPGEARIVHEGARSGIEVQRSEQLPRFLKKEAIQHVRKLASRIGVRVRATRAERRGARYIAAQFRDLGYKVRVQKFSVDGGTSRNVIARWPGSIRYPFVFGAHMDSVAGAPGTNDNASGVGVLIDIARLTRKGPQVRFARFVAFGSEEYGRDGTHHVGSSVFVHRMWRRGRRRTPGMVSIDMVADGRPLIDGTAGIGPTIVARTIYNKVRRAGIRVVYRTTCDCSDNGPFERAGIPAAFLWSGYEPDYHEPSDTVPNLSPKDLRRTGRAVRAFAKDLDKGMIRRFRRG